uniref:B30.2/SPRY domain-containing protein n=1 Tax=Neogobius melanostomus TaxID=47308 RepID=A0A8C6TNE5_9GOBI
MVEQRRKKIQELQSSVQLSQRAVDREKSTGLQAFSALIESVQRSRERFIQELQEKHRHIQTQAEALLQQLKQEICELEQRSTEAEQLLRSEDHLHFLQHCPPETFEGTAARALTELEENLKETFTEEIKKELQAKLKRVQQFAVDLTLDTDTAYVKLSVSKDLKQVHHTNQKNFRDSPQRFTCIFNILTKQSFSSGRFYFEVQVKDKTAWVLGVAKESVERKKRDTLNSKYGYWCICLESGNVFVNYHEPRVPLSLKRFPQKVGVFVDYDEGLVSFYDADTADLIYSFTGCSFREKLFPFLNPNGNQNGSNSASLILTAFCVYCQ